MKSADTHVASANRMKNDQAKLVIATSRPWNESMAVALSKKLGREFKLVTSKEELTLERLEAINPRYIFFPHWSYLIPEAVFEKFECVIFHMTDLPFGRGGSPLQNLISRGITETRITALRCVKELDAGPIYLKAPLSLHGAAEEIFLRAASVIENMIEEIVTTEPEPQAQVGQAIKFKRRGPEESELPSGASLAGLFDQIRMLDAEGYPRAFIEWGGYRLEFSRAALKQDHLMADVKITKVEHE